MIFKPMDPELALKAIEGQENILAPRIAEVDRYFSHLRCPECGGEVMKYVDPTRPLFLEGDLTPNYMARCRACEVEFEPYTRIQTSAPR